MAIFFRASDSGAACLLGGAGYGAASGGIGLPGLDGERG
jgi:hypothetical protein